MTQHSPAPGRTGIVGPGCQLKCRDRADRPGTVQPADQVRDSAGHGDSGMRNRHGQRSGSGEGHPGLVESQHDGTRDQSRRAAAGAGRPSGSSGRKSIIPSNAAEWAMIIASYGRANEWAGISAGPAHPVRMAVVSSATAWHQSARVAATIRSPFIATDRLDAGWPIEDIVARLNDQQPDVLVAYASMIRALAAEQLTGLAADNAACGELFLRSPYRGPRHGRRGLARVAVQRVRRHRDRRDRRRVRPPSRLAPVRGPGNAGGRRRRLPAGPAWPARHQAPGCW